MKEKLKKCPFCFGCAGTIMYLESEFDLKTDTHTNKLAEDGAFVAYTVCGDCGARGPKRYGPESHIDANNSWNKRADTLDF